MLKKICQLIFLFIVGAIAGIFSDQILWPYFIERPLFYQYGLERQPIYVTERKEVIIEENIALTEAVAKTEKAIVAISSKSKAGKIINGSGLIVSSEGLVLTLAEMVPAGFNSTVFLEGQSVSGQVLKRDLKENLALLKIEQKNLLTLGFSDFSRLRLGERVFIVSASLVQKQGASGLAVEKSVNEGIVKKVSDDSIQTNILESAAVKASPLLNIKGEVVGLNNIDSVGRLFAIPAPKLRSFLGF